MKINAPAIILPLILLTQGVQAHEVCQASEKVYYEATLYASNADSVRLKKLLSNPCMQLSRHYKLDAPLFFARSLATFQLLLKAGANIEEKNKDGHDILNYLAARPITFNAYGLKKQIEYREQGYQKIKNIVNAQDIEQSRKDKALLDYNQQTQEQREYDMDQLIAWLVKEKNEKKILKNIPHDYVLNIVQLARPQAFRMLTDYNAQSEYKESLLMLSLRPYCGLKNWQYESLHAIQSSLAQQTADWQQRNKFSESLDNYYSAYNHKVFGLDNFTRLKLVENITTESDTEYTKAETLVRADNEYCAPVKSR